MVGCLWQLVDSRVPLVVGHGMLMHLGGCR